MLKAKGIMEERRVFAGEFKERAVELALKTDRKQSEIAQELGINQTMLARWKQEVKRSETGPMKAFTSREMRRMKRRHGCGKKLPACAK